MVIGTLDTAWSNMPLLWYDLSHRLGTIPALKIGMCKDKRTLHEDMTARH